MTNVIDREISEVPRIKWKADSMLAFLSRGLEYKNIDVTFRLYKALARLHLEYGEQIWAPFLSKDVLEQVKNYSRNK